METAIYQQLDNGRVKCGICNHFCTIEQGKRGICMVRENKDGKLVSLVYSKVLARAIDPIEKKPIFHILPGSESYSIATAGCNFRCNFCQNSDISQLPYVSNSMNGNASPIRGVTISPEDIVAQAIKAQCSSISYTYTEPTVYFEFALDCARIAHEHGLLNIFVTNGFMSEELIKMIAPYLDGANVDLKAFSDDFYRKNCRARIEPVKSNIILMKSLGIIVEITTLLIPGLNDSTEEIKSMAEFIAKSVGVDTPWHISRFHPSYQMTDKTSTPLSSLMEAYKAGRDAGLRYVYTGNTPGLDSENTYCHVCGKLLVRRYGYTITDNMKPGGRCPECGSEAYGIFR